MKSFNTLATLSFIFALLLIPLAYSQEISRDLILTLEINKESFKIYEPIWITSKITNVSDRTIALPKDILWNEMILTRDGAKPQIITADGPIITKKEDFIILESEKSYDSRFDLTKCEMYKLDSGTWYFQMINAYSSPTDLHPQGWTGTLKSNTIKFTIQKKSNKI